MKKTRRVSKQSSICFFFLFLLSFKPSPVVEESINVFDPINQRTSLPLTIKTAISNFPLISVEFFIDFFWRFHKLFFNNLVELGCVAFLALGCQREIIRPNTKCAVDVSFKSVLGEENPSLLYRETFDGAGECCGGGKKSINNRNSREEIWETYRTNHTLRSQ